LIKLNRQEEALQNFKNILDLEEAPDETLPLKGMQERIQSCIGTQQLNPARAIEQYLLAFHQATREQFQDALFLLKEARKLNPLNPLICCDEGQIHIHLEDFYEALDSYDRALELDPSNLSALYNKALCLLGLGRVYESIEFCETKEKIYPRFPHSETLKKTARQILSNLRIQFEEGMKTKSHRRDDPLFSLHMGIRCMKLEEFNEAVSFFDQFIAHGGMDDKVHLDKGTALLELGKFRSALDEFEHLISGEPENLFGTTFVTVFLLKARALIELGQTQEAFDVYHTYMKLTSKDPSILKTSGHAYSKHGTEIKDAETLNLDQQLQPTNVELLYIEGGRMENILRYTKFREGIFRAVELKPECQETVFAKGKLHLLLKEYGLALKAFQRACHLEPFHGNCQFYRGLCLAHEKKFQEAFECFNIAEELEADQATVLLMKGVLYEQLEYYNQAARCYEKGIEILPARGLFDKYMGQILEKMERKDESRQFINQALEKDKAYYSTSKIFMGMENKNGKIIPKPAQYLFEPESWEFY